MKPHGVIEARHLHLAVGPTNAVWQECSVEQGHVACIRDDAGVQHVVGG